MARLSTGWSMSPTSNTAADATDQSEPQPNGLTMRRSAPLTLILAVVLSGTVANAHAEQGHPTAPTASRDVSYQLTSAMKISIKIQDRIITATLSDNATARDFAFLLPMTVTLNDYASTEKVSDLPRRLSTQGAPEGSDPSVGDITYYAPWGNLAIFYRDFHYSSGLIKLGRIESGMEALNVPRSMQATIEFIGRNPQ
jgi:hypothetical protein